MSAELALMPILHGLLGSIRVLAMLLVGPVFNHPALGMRVRVMLALMIAWAAAPTGAGEMAGLEWGVGPVIGAVALELLVGLSAGLGASLIFAAFLQMGEFIAVQGGLGAARSIDPVSGASSVAIGMALDSFAMMVFLLIGGHHEMIRGIVLSFTAIPIGGSMPDSEIFLEIARLGSVIYEVAFRLAGPVTVAIFIQNVATGVLGRAMPQLNLLIVNLPLHVGTMLLIIGLGANDLIHAMKDAIEGWPAQVFGLLLGKI
jgi:flagellar biosynthetic protein FliR